VAEAGGDDVRQAVALGRKVARYIARRAFAPLTG
jgi:hypothetical protein